MSVRAGAVEEAISFRNLDEVLSRLKAVFSLHLSESVMRCCLL